MNERRFSERRDEWDGRYGIYQLKDVSYPDGVKRQPVCVVSMDKLTGVGRAFEMLADDLDEWADEHPGEIKIVPVYALFDKEQRRWFSSLWYPKP